MILNASLKRYFKGFVYPAEIIMCAVYKKCRFGLSYRDIEELFAMRGLQIDHATLARCVIRTLLHKSTSFSSFLIFRQF